MTCKLITNGFILMLLWISTHYLILGHNCATECRDKYTCIEGHRHHVTCTCHNSTYCDHSVHCVDKCPHGGSNICLGNQCVCRCSRDSECNRCPDTGVCYQNECRCIGRHHFNCVLWLRYSRYVVNIKMSIDQAFGKLNKNHMTKNNFRIYISPKHRVQRVTQGNTDKWGGVLTCSWESISSFW